MAGKRYADDYETVISTDGKGNEKKTAVYRGDYFEISLDAEGLSRFKRNCLMLLAAIIVLHISGGFVNNPGMNQFFIGLPYAAAFFPMVYLAAAILRIPKGNHKYRRDEIGLSFDRVKTASFILVILMGFGILGEILFILVFSSGQVAPHELLYLILEVSSAAAVFTLITFQRQIRISVIENNLKKHMS